MAEKVRALYFEDTGINLLVTRGTKAEKWASVPLEPGLIVDGVIEDEVQVAEKVRELLESIKYAQNETSGFRKFTESVTNFLGMKGKVVVGLNGRDSLYRVLSLPVLNDALLKEAVYREAGRVLPVSLDELYLAYQRIPGNSNETRVFIAAFPKKATDALISTLKSAGLKPNMLDLAPLSLCLSVNEPRAIIAHAKNDTLNIVVMADRVPLVIRSLVLQSEERTIEDNLTTISEEFSRTVAFYNSSHQQEPLDSDTPVFVSGDLANTPDLWETIVGKLEAKVDILPSIIDCPEDFPMSDFVINLGLATKGLNLDKLTEHYSLVNLNALPEWALPKPINPYRIIVPVVAVAGIIGIIFLWMSWNTDKKTTENLQNQLTDIQNLIDKTANEIRTITAENEALEKEIDPIKKAAEVLINKIDGLEASRLLTDNELNQIINFKPDSVIIAELIYGDTSKSLSGYSSDYDEILNYARSLKNVAGFNVLVNSIQYSDTVTDTGEVIPSYDFSFNIDQ